MVKVSSTKLKTNGKWLAWARKMSNYHTRDIAKKLNVDSQKIQNWEEHGYIEHDNLIKLSDYYNRSPMFFFNVNNPSYEEYHTPDFRTVDSKENELSPLIIKEVINAQNKRKNFIILEEDLEDYEIHNFNFNFNEKNVKELAEYVRDKLGITKAKIDTLKNGKNSLDYWIEKIESLDILVFQFYGIKPNEMRGYALYHDKLPIIGINGKENLNGKKFTLFHELVHLIIKKEGISNINNFKLKNKTEVFCNAVAAEILVPTNTFEIKIKEDDISTWDDTQIKRLSSYFKVSGEVILRKLLSLNHSC
ncbi:ImmA/IrrE family metallo-endopeptidase [Methanobrevibacter filiformis]|uniref:Helix-turn-helix domain protein n=1 Tax=Methanobrevibacter filiformis TaxID=55758 RepID=A0A166AGB5_9EURY|nr:ImmA/IrrE family metallo-endopeptidase [Methanobrevibacter filiformis]KZX11998.1 helix-turn-helix domain protein [Methanobrevibacter filiformis]